MTDITSPYYPYYKVHDAYFGFDQFAYFPKKICDYLINAPQGLYTPPDDNTYPRCRLWKYLYYDGAHPLDNPLPTIQQKMDVLFNPEHPTEPPTDKGYRLFPQQYIKQSQTDAQTRIYCYMGRTVANAQNNTFAASVIFDVFTYYGYELNTKTDVYSRSGAIVADLIEALHGVCMDGIGTFQMAKQLHPDSGTRAIFDGDTNVGHELIIGLEMSTTANRDTAAFNNLPNFGDNQNIKII